MTPPEHTLLENALAYARAGLAVLPLTPGGKTPLGSLVPHGKVDATADTEVVRDWWVQCPTANIGVRVPEGMVVLDVDPRNGGASALVELSRQHGGLTPTWTAWTGGGGLHAWYGVTGAVRGQLCPGVDLKSHTGYVVMPPSLHPSGRHYDWGNLLPIAVAPRWLAELAVAPAVGVGSTARTGVFSPTSGDALVRFVAGAAAGNRNNVLHWAGCRAAERPGGGKLFDRLHAAAVAVGLTPGEAAATLASARTGGGVPA